MRAAVFFCLCALVSAQPLLPRVPTLNGPEFKSLLTSSDEQVAVGIVQKGQCGQPCEMLENFMQQLTAKMKGFFKTCIVDVRTAVDVGTDEMTMHSMFNITTIPMIFIYRYGVKDVKQALILNTNTTAQIMGAYGAPNQPGQPPNQKQVHDVFLQFLPTRVERLNKGNLKDFLQREPERARVLLVTSKTITPPMYTKLSLDHGAGVLFGELRSGDAGAVEELAKLGGPKIEKFPKLIMQKALGDGWAAPTDVYSGALGLAPIGEAIAKINPGPRVPELTSEDAMKAECANKGGVCLVAVLPSRFEKSLEQFKAVAKRWFGTEVVMANFVWVNEEKQENFVNAFKLENFPGLIALNARKKLYSVFVGTFDAETLYSFVLRVLNGKESLSKVDKVPKIEKSAPTMPAGKLDALLGGMGRKREL